MTEGDKPGWRVGGSLINLVMYPWTYEMPKIRLIDRKQGKCRNRSTSQREVGG
jgi:hypothetical protein